MKNKIYVLWWQGFDNAPEIVKICQSSLHRSYDHHSQEIVLLDKRNIFNYLELPGYIIDKFRQGIITVTHLSDIIRAILLKENSGLWADATMFFPNPISSELFKKDFFTLRNPSSNKYSITSKWECFFIAGQKDFPLFSLLQDMWFEYWKRENELIAYLLTDHLFYIGYIENIKIRNAIDLCPSFYYKIDYFQNLMNQKYNEKKYNEIIGNERYIKLTYKNEDLFEKIDNNITYFGKLKEVYCK